VCVCVCVCVCVYILYIYIYMICVCIYKQIHWPDRYVPLFGPNKYDVTMETAAVSFEEQLEAMNELIQQGKIRHWGLSNETPFGVMAFVSLAMEQVGSAQVRARVRARAHTHYTCIHRYVHMYRYVHVYM
jgi:aryl-alcohol dehydrogenase-like predicted oxidoreductase